MKQQLDFQQLVSQSIVEGATTPNPGGTGVLCWSTSDSTVKRWNATSWNQLGSVSSVALSGGTTGLTSTGGPITTSGTLTLGGTLAVANGGTGVTATPSNGQLLIGNGSGFTLAALTGTANQLTVTNAAGSVTLSLPSQVNVTNLNASGQLQTTTASVAAAGTTQGTATSISSASTLVSSGTGGVVFAAAPVGAGYGVEVVNRSGAAITVYPQSGGAIDALGTNAGYVMANTATVQFVSLSTTQWYTVGALNVIAAGSGISVTASSGTTTIANLGVTTLAGTTNQITASASSGAVTLSLPNPAAAIYAASAAINTTETLIQKLLVGTAPTQSSTYRIELYGTCTSTAANVSTFTVRIGTAGTTADTSVFTITCTAATSGTAVPFNVQFLITFRSATSVIGNAVINNNGITGISSSAYSVASIGAATTITNAANYLDVTYKSAATTTTTTFQSAVIYQVR